MLLANLPSRLVPIDQAVPEQWLTEFLKGFTEALITDTRINTPHVKVSVVMPGTWNWDCGKQLEDCWPGRKQPGDRRSF